MKEVKDYLREKEERLKELGLKITFDEKGNYSAKGGSAVFNSAIVNEALILTAKLEGFKEALDLLNVEI